MNAKRFFYEVVWSRGGRIVSEIHPRLIDAYTRRRAIMYHEIESQPEVWRVEVQRDCRVKPNGRPA